jgi:hypothetical protein
MDAAPFELLIWAVGVFPDPLRRAGPPRPIDQT